jgi:sugar/nucleoside kinase (ribokinase family)
MKQYDVVAVGRAYTDIIAAVTDDFLKKWDIPQNGDRRFEVDDLTRIQDELKNTKVYPGGPSGNTVSTLAALGGTAGFFGKVNADKTGEAYLEDFRERGVDIINDPYDRTINLSPTCLVLETSDGSRSFAYNPGCADAFVSMDFSKFDFSSTKFFLIEAHLLNSSTADPFIRSAVAQAATQCQIVFNLQGIASWEAYSKAAHYLTSVSKIIIGNEAEHLALANTVGDVRRANAMQIITKGEKGSEAIDETGEFQIGAIPPWKFVSSTGAGDAFAAGFLLGQSRNLDISKSLNCGASAASMIISVESGRPVNKAPGTWARLMP